MSFYSRPRDVRRMKRRTRATSIMAYASRLRAGRVRLDGHRFGARRPGTGAEGPGRAANAQRRIAAAAKWAMVAVREASGPGPKVSGKVVDTKSVTARSLMVYGLIVTPGWFEVGGCSV